MQLTMGRIVHYRATTEDRNHRQAETGKWYPAIVISASHNVARLRVFFDTADDTKAGIKEGEELGAWRWPPKAFGE